MDSIAHWCLNAHPSTLLLHDVSVSRHWFCSCLSQQNSTFKVTEKNSKNRMTGYDEIMHSVKVATRRTAACVFSNSGSPETNDSSVWCSHLSCIHSRSASNTGCIHSQNALLSKYVYRVYGPKDVNAMIKLHGAQPHLRS